MKLFLASALTVFALSSTGMSRGMKNFDITQLPFGKQLTLMKSATTLVPVGNRVVLKSTDVPQSLKLTPYKKRGKARPIRIALMEIGTKKIRYVDIKPGLPFVYSFRGLSQISIVPDSLAAKQKGLMLQVESDRPLEISR